MEDKKREFEEHMQQQALAFKEKVEQYKRQSEERKLNKV
jgi:hypothetical protein